MERLSFSLLILLQVFCLAPNLFWLQNTLRNFGSFLIIIDLVFIVAAAILLVRKRKVEYFFYLLLLSLFAVSFAKPLANFFINYSVESKQQTITLYYVNAAAEKVNLTILSEILAVKVPDLLVVLDINSEQLAPIKDSYPYQTIITNRTERKLAILSKYELSPIKAELEQEGAGYLVQGVRVGEQEIELTLWNAAVPSSRSAFYDNKTYCRQIATRAKHSTLPQIVIGNFKANTHSRCYSWFAHSELYHALWGRGLFRSWPAKFFGGLSLIDHAFYSKHFAVDAVTLDNQLNLDHKQYSIELSF